MVLWNITQDFQFRSKTAVYEAIASNTMAAPLTTQGAMTANLI